MLESMVSPAAAAALIGWSDDAIIGLTLEGIVTSWNAGAERMYGYTAAEMVGYRIHRLVPHELQEAERHRVERAARGDGVRAWDAPRVCRDGSRLIVSSSCFPIRDDRYRITAVGVIERDVTKDRAIEAELFEAKRMEVLARLSVGAAHEFNNINTAILGFANRLSERQTDAASRADVDGIVQQAVRASHVSHHLLAFSDRTSWVPERASINDTLRSMEPLLQRLLGERVWLALSLDSGNTAVRAPMNDLELLIFEMVMKAGDAIGGQGTIALSAFETVVDENVFPAPAGVPSGRFIEIELRANAGGEDAGDSPLSSVASGAADFEACRMGMIANAARRVGAHVVTTAALCDAANDHVISLFIPAALAEGVTPAGATDAIGASDETILLVEDDDAVRDITNRVLSSQGYTVLQARDGEDALSVAEAHAAPIDLVVSDVVMPHMDGRVLFDRLRGWYPGIRFLFVSGYTRGAVEADQLRGPVTDFLAKPFTVAELSSRVRRLLDRPSRQAAGSLTPLR